MLFELIEWTDFHIFHFLWSSGDDDQCLCHSILTSVLYYYIVCAGIAVVHDSLPMLVLALLADVSAFSFRTGPITGQHVFLLQQHNYEHLICRPTIYCASSRKLLTARFNIDCNFFNHVDFGSEYWGCICQSSIQYLSGQDCL